MSKYSRIRTPNLTDILTGIMAQHGFPGRAFKPHCGPFTGIREREYRGGVWSRYIWASSFEVMQFWAGSSRRPVLKYIFKREAIPTIKYLRPLRPL